MIVVVYVDSILRLWSISLGIAHGPSNYGYFVRWVWWLILLQAMIFLVGFFLRLIRRGQEAMEVAFLLAWSIWNTRNKFIIENLSLDLLEQPEMP